MKKATLLFVLACSLVLGLSSNGQINNKSANYNILKAAQPEKFSITTNLNEEKEIHTELQKEYLSYEGEYVSISEDLYPDGMHHLSEPNPVNLDWDYTPISGKELQSYSVTYGKEEDLSDGYEVEGNDLSSIDLYNSYLGTNYFRINAKYTDGTIESSEIKSYFVEETFPRNLKIEGMTNCRDLGGRKLTNGSKIKQGLIYRTSGTHGWGQGNADKGVIDTITTSGKEELLNHLGVKTEITIDSSGNNRVGVENFVPAYMDYNGGKHHFYRNTESLKTYFKAISNIDNYPIFFHCRIGTDRTGLCALMTNALLGVEKNDIYQDYLFSNFGNIQQKRYLGDKAGEDNILRYIEDIDAMPGNTFQQKTYNILLALGVPREQLDSVINILTEGPSIMGNEQEQLPLFGDDLITDGFEASTSQDRQHPAKYAVLNSQSKSVYSSIYTDKEYDAVIVGYLGNSNKSTSKFVDEAIRVDVDGTTIEVERTSYSDAGFGNCNGRMNYAPVILGKVTLTEGPHIVTIFGGNDTINVGGITIFHEEYEDILPPEEDESNDSNNKGCNGSVVAITSLIGSITLLGVGLALYKRKEKQN